MNLYIQIENGQPINHPAFEDNLQEAFGSVPSNWAPFNRTQQPNGLLTTPFQTAQCTYALSSDGVTWEDVWIAVDMTEAEKSALIAERQANPPGPNLTLNTTTLQWTPNTAKPIDGQKYRWDTPTGTWVVIPTT